GVDEIFRRNFIALVEPDAPVAVRLPELVEASIVADGDPALSHGIPQVGVEAGAVHVPSVAVAVKNAVLHPGLAAPGGLLRVAGDMSRGAELFPEPQNIQRISYGAGKGFPV